MKLQIVGCVTLLCAAFVGDVRSDQSPIAAKAKAGAVLPPAAKAPSRSKEVAIEMQIWEVHGEEARALQDSGFRQVGGLLRLGGDDVKRSGSGAANSAQDLLQLIRNHSQLTGVVVPKITTSLGRATGLKMGLGVTSTHLHYMVRTGEKTFELKQLPADAVNSLGLTVDMTPQAVPGGPQLITISPLKITFTTVDGHEPVPGVDLEIGKPILSTRKLDTSVTLVDGGDAMGLVLPGPEGRQPILLISVHRVPED